MRGNTVIVADSKIAARKGLKNLLKSGGYNVVAEAANAPDLLRKARTIYPDMVVMDEHLEGGTTSEIAGILEDDLAVQALVIVSENYFSRFDSFAYVKKPYTEASLLSAVEISMYYGQKMQTIQKEVGRLQETINKRRLVDQAKALLIQQFGMDEAAAYRYIQKLSMDLSRPMKEVALQIIQSEEKSAT